MDGVNLSGGGAIPGERQLEIGSCKQEPISTPRTAGLGAQEPRRHDEIEERQEPRSKKTVEDRGRRTYLQLVATSLLVAPPSPANERRRLRARERAMPRVFYQTFQLGELYPGERPQKGPISLPSWTAKWAGETPRARFIHGIRTRGKGRDPGLFPAYQMSPEGACS